MRHRTPVLAHGVAADIRGHVQGWAENMPGVNRAGRWTTGSTAGNRATMEPVTTPWTLAASGIPEDLRILASAFPPWPYLLMGLLICGLCGGSMNEPQPPGRMADTGSQALPTI